MAYIFVNNINNEITIEGLKIIDINLGGISGFCRCSISDRNSYDKESGTIICKNYSICLRNFLKHCDESTKKDILEHINAIIGR